MTQPQQERAQPIDNPATELPANGLPLYVTIASKAVKRAQEQLREAQDVEKAMQELAQLQEVRQAHRELYSPDKETGLTVAQQYLAFKQQVREQSEQR